LADDTLEPYDATDPAAEQNARRDEARRQRDTIDVMRAILGTKKGRAWLCDKLEKCHIYGSPFMPGQPDATAFALGEENVGKQLMLEAIDADAGSYMKLLAERKEEEARQQEVRNREERKRQQQSDEDSAAMKTQGFDLPAPGTEPKPLTPGSKIE
jgi:hypothetical protein